MIATSVPSARFATSARVAAVPARGVVARCMKSPEPETDAAPSSTSEGGVKDTSSAIALDAPSQPVETAVLGPVQGACLNATVYLTTPVVGKNEAILCVTACSYSTTCSLIFYAFCMPGQYA